jgi:signal transduction histidine kinase
VALGFALQGERLTITLADDGCGFGPEQPVVGAGRGLGNMHSRAEHLGGALALASEPGAGTTVTFEMVLPRLEGEPP